MLSAEETDRLLRTGAVARLVRRDGVVVEGAGAFDWLQGQVTQDLVGLEAGGARWTLVLSPQGKIDALARVWRPGEERFVLEVEEGFGEALEERLRRFKLRVRANLERVELGVLECRGPEAGTLVVEGAVGESWGGFAGWDLCLAEGSEPPIAAEGDPAAFEAARIEAGVPRLGRELTERTIPQEAGAELVSRTVSFTKGCYTGQELVARLDARGAKVPRRLVAAELDGDAAPGDELLLGGEVVGQLTSVAWSPGKGRAVALGYLARRVETPLRLTVGPPPGRAGEAVEAEVHAPGSEGG